MKKISIDFRYLIFLWGVLIVAIFFSFAHHGNLLIDSGREVYYPTQILSGKILYKDIFNIYGPFAYMFNAILFKVFGINLNVLYLSGCVCAFCIVSLTYLIAKRFLSEFISFSIAIFTISIGVLNLNLFNFIFPYSYGMLYGVVAFLVSLFFAFKFTENVDKKIYIYLTCFFTGLCVTSKYEFIPYLLVVFYLIMKNRPFKILEYCYIILSFIFVPLFCFGILFLQGLGISDLASTLIIIKKMSHCQTLLYFYQNSGIFFHRKTPLFMVAQFIMTVIPLTLLVYGFRVNQKFLKIILFLVSLILLVLFINPISFMFLPVLVLVLAFLNYKNVIKNIPLAILVLSCITISAKVFWGLTTLNYGVFFAGILILTTLTLLKIKFNSNFGSKAIGIYLLIVSVIFGYQNILLGMGKNCLLKTQNGQIYLPENICEASKELIKYIYSNTKKTDKIVILPEGTFINFLTNRKSDDYYNSLIPLYIETFGEEKIITHFKDTKPDYIIFNNWNTKDYYFSHICNDYALGFCSFVAKNYTQEKIIDKGFRYLIFKRK